MNWTSVALTLVLMTTVGAASPPFYRAKYMYGIPPGMSDALHWQDFNMFKDYLQIIRIRPVVIRGVRLCIADDPGCDRALKDISDEISFNKCGEWFRKYPRDESDVDCVNYLDHSELSPLPEGTARMGYLRKIKDLGPRDLKIRWCKLRNYMWYYIYYLSYHPSNKDHSIVKRGFLELINTDPEINSIEDYDRVFVLVGEEMEFIVLQKWGLLPLTVRE